MENPDGIFGLNQQRGGNPVIVNLFENKGWNKKYGRFDDIYQKWVSSSTVEEQKEKFHYFWMEKGTTGEERREMYVRSNKKSLIYLSYFIYFYFWMEKWITGEERREM